MGEGIACTPTCSAFTISRANRTSSVVEGTSASPSTISSTSGAAYANGEATNATKSSTQKRAFMGIGGAENVLWQMRREAERGCRQEGLSSRSVLLGCLTD